MQTSSSTLVLCGISSMATKALLVDLTQVYLAQTGVSVQIESVGGVDAAKRVQAGEAFDVVVLASDAIDKLMASGHIAAGSRVDLVRSGVAVAVRAGAAHPDISSEAAVRAAVPAARFIFIEPDIAR
jgi:molybdate transport system substrate-binding protein